MWKKYITILEKSPSHIKDYFEYAYYYFPDLLNKLPKAKLLEKINKPNNDLFYQRKNMDNFFYEGKTSEVVACFNHYFEINWDFLSFHPNDMHSDLDNRYQEEFSHFQQSNFSNHMFLDLERLLSVDGYKNQFIFLFLFFMPCISKKELFFHFKKNRPLISCNAVSMENFYMLQDLMKNYEKESYSLFCKNYNFNHQLVEDYMESSQTLVGYQNGIKWEEELPMEKINILLDEGCSFTDFELFRIKKNKAIYPNLYSILMEIQSSLVSDRLQHKLYLKSDNKKTIKL